jgi:hypothetical protein
MKKFSLVAAVLFVATTSMWAAGTTMVISIADAIKDCVTHSVTVDYTITTTAADGASVTETLRQGDTVVKANTYSILSGNVPGGWVFAGRTKSHDGQFQASNLADGSYALEIGVTQAGSGGNPGKTDCQTQVIVMACASTSACANTEPFGEVVGRKEIGDDATVQVNFRGDFGPTAYLAVNKNGSTIGGANISQNGDSCNYHANWKFTNGSGADIYGNDGPGVYTLTVTGNGQDPLEFSINLVDTPDHGQHP